MRLGVAAALVGGSLVPGDVEVADGVIAAVGLEPRGGGIAAPGFVDLQVNGFGGIDLMRASADGWTAAGEAMLATGVTAYRPTVITAAEDEMAGALASIAGGAEPAAHPRRPPRGAVPLPRPARRAPARAPPRPGPRAARARCSAAGPVAHVTLAPELPGADELIDLLTGRGVLVAAGHSDATAAEAHAAFDRGVRTVTHLFNAMRPPVAREPGLALAALARDDVTVQLIADGHHVAGDAMRVAWAAARGRLALVTDAVAAAGAGDGTFTLGGRPVRAEAGVVRDAEGRLAGSALTMDAAVRRLHALGAPLEEALAAASAVPAALAGRPELGALAPGAPADVVVLDDRLEVVRTLVAGVEG